MSWPVDESTFGNEAETCARLLTKERRRNKRNGTTECSPMCLSGVVHRITAASDANRSDFDGERPRRRRSRTGGGRVIPTIQSSVPASLSPLRQPDETSRRRQRTITPSGNRKKTKTGEKLNESPRLSNEAKQSCQPRREEGETAVPRLFSFHLRNKKRAQKNVNC